MSAIDKDSGVRESESEDELPQLSEYAQAALQEFYQEQTAREQELQCQQELGDAHGHLRVQEDWVSVKMQFSPPPPKTRLNFCALVHTLICKVSPSASPDVTDVVKNGYISKC